MPFISIYKKWVADETKNGGHIITRVRIPISEPIPENRDARHDFRGSIHELKCIVGSEQCLSMCFSNMHPN